MPAVFCFARTTHTYLDMNAGTDFDTKIVVKVNAPELLRRELRAKRWKGEPIAMGTATDPYQRAEGRYRLMPPIIEALTEARNPFSILTKGTLLVRDIDLLRAASEVTDVSTAHEHLPHTRSQVQQDRRDTRGAGVDGGADDVHQQRFDAPAAPVSQHRQRVEQLQLPGAGRGGSRPVLRPADPLA